MSPRARDTTRRAGVHDLARHARGVWAYDGARRRATARDERGAQRDLSRAPNSYTFARDCSTHAHDTSHDVSRRA
jgi:hypothetical protein